MVPKGVRVHHGRKAWKQTALCYGNFVCVVVQSPRESGVGLRGRGSHSVGWMDQGVLWPTQEREVPRKKRRGQKIAQAFPARE